MAVLSPVAEGRSTDRFRHEALFYEGVDGLVDAIVPFIREGVEHEQATLVALPSTRIGPLRDALGDHARGVRFADMETLGANPARIIPAWRQFRDEFPGPVRGVGEPVWAGRRDVEIDECQLHESLLNVAFDPGPGWWLVCPYDVAALPESVAREAMRTHPSIRSGRPRSRVGYAGPQHAHAAFMRPLTSAPSSAQRFGFGLDDLSGLRAIVARCGQQAGLPENQVEDLALAAHEIATNSILHGGGRGVLQVWQRPDALVVEVRDTGTIDDPLVGRELSTAFDEGGRGVWMANQLCDLVQVRSTDAGTVVRLYAWRA